ncbi:hypothetical protein E0493_19885 [Roseomonas sp. M0104]|uniref:Septum formation inhibitor-activating ATPase n=1 Tax=Teichococcus coralli TaxID=2545983 RepID=A0A845BDF2_9PROT|nr:hypothetical protein [Pseudoroseomonas coralli]MXP65613.1 hypothetical protein [Pseudoroseomonas coralli]
MNARPNLADLDRALGAARHPALLLPTELKAGGVDPLGLRQVNLDLMAAAWPDFNNVTARIRPYVFMAWAWWKAREVFESRGQAATRADDLQALVDRWEVLFLWSHLLAEAEVGLPGRNVLTKYLPRPRDGRSYRFGGAEWDKLRSSRRWSTALMAPIQYGPSIKALRWLEPRPAGTFAPSTDAMPAVRAFEEAVGRRLPAELLAPGDLSITPEEALALYGLWDVTAPTEVERDTFRALFLDAGLRPGARLAAARRRALLLVRSVLRQNRDSLSEAEVRRALASGRLRSGAVVDGPEADRGTLLLFGALQARQLQRLALEAMLSWILGRIPAGEAVGSDDLVRDADAAARAVEEGADASSVGGYLALAAERGGRDGWPAACAYREETDVLFLMRALAIAQDEGGQRVPGLALRALAYTDAMAAGLRAAGLEGAARGHLGGHPDRLPLDRASRRLAALSGRPMRELWREVILSWVLAQHVRWSIARNGDGTQRLRLALDEGGWTRLRSGPAGIFGATPDRLWAALSLSADCGILTMIQGGDGSRMYATS